MPDPLDISEVRFLPELAAHDFEVRAIAAEAFGPGRFVRAAERVREMAEHDRGLSFVAEFGGEIVASVRQSPIMIGSHPALMLGPLAVRPRVKGSGIGRKLLAMAADAAVAKGEQAIILIGDPPYYAPHGYRPLPGGSIVMQRPYDPARMLGLALVDGALDGLAGVVGPRR